MRHFGLTITQFWALVHLEDEEGRSLSELANLLICDKSNVTSIVDKMEEMGLAERKRGKAGTGGTHELCLHQKDGNSATG